jgi:hypothetical protein
LVRFCLLPVAKGEAHRNGGFYGILMVCGNHVPDLNRDKTRLLLEIRESARLIRFSSFHYRSAISAQPIKGVLEILARLSMSIGLVNGQALLPFVSSFGAANDYIGLEISDPMSEAARDHFNDHPHGNRVSIQSSDLCRKAHRMALGPHDAPPARRIWAASAIGAPIRIPRHLTLDPQSMIS